RLAGAPAQGGRPGRLYLLLPVRPLPRVSQQRAGRLSREDRAAARAVAVSPFSRRVRRVLLLASARRALPRPRHAARPDGRAGDFVGFPQVIPEGIEMLRSGGTYLEIGTISRGAKVELEPSLLVWGSKTIVGVIQYDPWVIPRALDFLVRNRTRWPFDRLLSH